jgi:hypothetical protein
VRLRQVGLHYHLRLARIGHVDAGEILGRALVGEPEDAAAVRRDLDRHAFAHAAEALQLMLGQQLEIPGDRLIAAFGQRARIGNRHVVLLVIVRLPLACFGEG